MEESGTVKTIKTNGRIPKTSTKNIDKIIDRIIIKFEIPEKEIRKGFKDILPKTSKYYGSKKVKKDKNAPKKVKSGYLFYCDEQRPILNKKYNNSKKCVEIVTELGHNWTKLHKQGKSDKYFKLHLKDRERYKMELEKYKKDYNIIDRKVSANANHPDYIENRKTGKWFKKTGKIGKQIMEDLILENETDESEEENDSDTDDTDKNDESEEENDSDTDENN